ncbi:MAG: phage tail sheath subtilisin-like domain-containing protein [Spirochaetota bacterium]|nr:phage tail sheath subtilisin-like domain-containing protein [Spirochaetota bacterium]
MIYKAPGIYIAPEPKRIEPITLSNKCVTGFIGIAERGPIHEGVRIKSFKQYQKIFGGFTGHSYLPYAVYSYFHTGGKECVVIRTAHLNEDNDINSASKASMICKDINENTSFEIKALSEGIWGNNIQLKLSYINSDTATVLKIDTENREWIEIESTEDFQVEDTICIWNRDRKEYKIISQIAGNHIYFDSRLDTIIDSDNQEIYCGNVRFNIKITHEKDVEEYFFLSINEDDDKYFIDEINQQSGLVEINKTGAISTPYEISSENLQGGKNGVLSLTPADFIGYYKGLEDNKGIGIFEAYNDVSLIAAPDVLLFEEYIYNDLDRAKKDIFIVQKAMIDQCERLGNRFVILDLPLVKDVIELMKWTGKFDSKVAAVYYPRIEMINPEDISSLSTVIVPPSGHIAGIYIDCDEKEGIFRAPANKFIKGAVGLTERIDDEVYEIIYPKGINCLRYIPGRGIKVWGARTLSSDISWRYINVRRTFSAISESIKQGTRWAVFETNDMALRKRIVRHIYAFLLDLWRKGFMSGVVPEDGFYIRCDDELNPPEEIDAGRINIEIGIAIARPAEFLVIKIRSKQEESMILIEG